MKGVPIVCFKTFIRRAVLLGEDLEGEVVIVRITDFMFVSFGRLII